MMLVAGKLRVCHVSTHVSLAQAIARVRPERILQVVALADAGIRQLGVARPHLAVAGLNPHAGEGGLFGSEEIEFSWTERWPAYVGCAAVGAFLVAVAVSAVKIGLAYFGS